MTLAKDQLDHIYMTEMKHLAEMFLQDKLTAIEFAKEVSELAQWVQETFNR